MDNSIRWVANLSLMFTEHSLLDRPAAARALGFEEVEFWWPFGTTGRPATSDVDAFVDAIEQADVSLTAMNLFAGDMPAGERGVLSYPERSDEFRDSVGIAMQVGRRLGTKLFNAPYGHRREGLEPAEQDQLADESLAFAARAAEAIDGLIMLEPVSGMPAYPIKSGCDAVAIVERVRRSSGAGNLGFLIDQFHVSMNGGDVLAEIEAYAGYITHVQLADTPGRGEPGSGDADIEGVVAALLQHGYGGAFALEYIPTTTTEDSVAAWRREVESWRGGSI